MRFITLFLVAVLSSCAEPLTPLKVKVVVVSMFEVDADSGDKPGEFQYWVEREKLDRVFPLPQAYHDVRANDDGSVIGIVTGMGNIRAAASIMALGLDPRFDLSQAYWLVAGIAGADPHDVSVGSAVWADWVVDGDLAHGRRSKGQKRDRRPRSHILRQRRPRAPRDPARNVNP